VSPSRATEPDASTTTACRAAVAISAAKLHHTVRTPSRLVSSARSTLSVLSWLCGLITWLSLCHITASLPPVWAG
jgi:hypothetical protein